MIDALARLLGIRRDQTEDALKSERAARATLNRRGFLLAGASASASLATGAIWSLPSVAVEPPGPFFGVDRAVDTARLAGSRLTTFDALLKERYLEYSAAVESLLFQPSPLLSMLERRP